MSWSHFVLAFVLGGVFLLGPGYAFLAAARVPAWHRLTLAPLVSAAWVAGLGIVMAWVHLTYDGWSVLIATIVGAAVVAALVRLTRVGRWLGVGEPQSGTQPETHGETQEAGPTTWLALGAALVVSLAIWLIEFVRPLSGPAAIARAYDVPWHAAIVKQFMVTGDGSTLTAASVDHTVGSTFYPAAWHDMVALTAGLGHAPVFGGINAVVLGELTLVWPLAMVALVTALFGRRPVTVLAGGVVGCLFLAFPLTYLTWGILYSNLYGYALLPALLALGVMLLDTKRGEIGRTLVAVLVVIGFVGDAIAQPNAVFTMAVILLPMLLATTYRLLSVRSRAAGVGACIALVVVAAVAWVGLAHTRLLHRTTTLDRVTAGGLGDAVKAVLLQEYNHAHPQWVLAGLIVLGAIVLLVRRRRAWLVVAHVLICVCYVVSASQPIETHLHWLRMNLTGYWYNDYFRLAAATVLSGVPLAVAALVWIAEQARRFGRGRGPELAVGVLLVALLAAGTITSSQFSNHRGLIQAMTVRNSELYGPRVDFLKQVAATVPAGQVVANNPFDGSVYGWPLFGLDTFYKSYSRNWIGHPSAAMVTIADHLDQAATDKKVCYFLRKYDVRWALKMTTRDRLVQFHWRGQDLTPHTPGFRLALKGPQARLYKITACGFGA